MEEVSMIQSAKDPMELHQNTAKKQSDVEDSMHKLHALDLQGGTSSEISKKVYTASKHNAITPKGTAIGGAPKGKLEIKIATESNVNEIRSNLSKPTRNSSSCGSESVPLSRRSSTGDLPEKQPMSNAKRQTSDVSSAGKRTSSLASETLRKSRPEIQRNSVPFINAKHATRPGITETHKSIPISPVAETLRTTSDSNTQDSSKKPSVRSSPSSVSSDKRIASPLLASTGSSSSVKKSMTKVSSIAKWSPSASNGSNLAVCRHLWIEVLVYPIVRN